MEYLDRTLVAKHKDGFLGSKLAKSARVAAFSAVVLLTGCAVSPQNFSQAEIQQINEADRNSAFSDVEPVGEVVTLDEAIARALKYNLEQKVKLLEQSLAAGELEAGKFDMLPKLLANAGYSTRDNYNLRYKADSATPWDINKNQSLEVSADKQHNTADLVLSWNLLDFGASYYTAKQNADKLLIANERRRKAMHNLIRNVRTAYWRAVASEQLEQRVRATITTAESALLDSSTLSSERVRAPDESLRYQRNLLESLRLLEDVERDLASARIELANLIGVLPGTRFKLEEPEAFDQPLVADMEQLEVRALLQNTDLREQFFNARIAAQATRKAMLKMLPGISFDYGLYYDNDRYLVDQQWDAAGVRVSFNLMNLIAGPSRMRAAEKSETLAQARRMALQMSVLTQVHLARHQYDDALRQYGRVDQIFTVDRQLEEHVQSQYQSGMIGEQTHISARVTTIFSELGRYQAMSKVQEAVGRLQSTLGMEPVLDSLDDVTLDQLKVEIRRWLENGTNFNALADETLLETQAS